MELYSDFCNICCKADNVNLKNICKGNIEHIKNTLITFIGNEDIINNDAIYLCTMCCEELIRFNKFRDMCFNNLIQLRQKYFNLKSKLELEEDEVTVTNTLKEFLHAEMLRYNVLGKNNSTELQETANDSAYLNNDKHSDDLQIQFTKDIHNEMQENTYQYIKIEKVQNVAGDDLDFDINNSHKNYFSQVEFVNAELPTKVEVDNITSEDFEMDCFVSEDCTVITNSDVSYNNPQIKSTREELHVKQENNACNIENSVDRDIGSEENVGGCNYTRNTGAVNMQQRSPRALDHRMRRWSTTLHLAPYEHAYTGGDLLTYAVCNKTCRRTSNYKCSVCNRTFSHSSHLTSHERTHSGIRPYKCTICYKAFTQSSSLTRHERIHTDTKPYICTICNKTFRDQASLTTHERIHTNYRPYKCTVCHKAFSHSSYLTSHERTHSGIRPFNCTVCNKAFTQSSSLTRHERIHSRRENIQTLIPVDKI